jgi:hypothetical protein
LMLELPAQLPAPLVHQLDRTDMVASVKSARHAAFWLASTFALIPLLVWTGIANAPLLVTIYALIATLAAIAYLQARRGRTNDFVPFVVGAVAIVLVSQLLSPFIIIPIVVCAFVVGLGGQAQLLRHPRLVLAAGLALFVVPNLLEMAHLLPRTWQLVDGKLVITPGLIHLSGTAAYALLLVGQVFLIAVICVFLRSLTANRRHARRAIEIQAWQLRQLLPARPPNDE